LAFLFDDLQEFLLNGFPSHLFTACRLGAATEKALEWKYPARRLHPFVINCSTHGSYVHTDLIGDLLHLEGLDMLGPFIEKSALMLNDSTRHLFQRVAALLDGVDQPRSGLNFLLEELLLLRGDALIAKSFHILPADVNLRGPVV